MLDFHWTEIIVVMIVTLLVVGPKDLPRVMRGFGNAMHKVRSLGNEFRRAMDQVTRESELEELRAQGNALKKLRPDEELRRMMEGDFPPDIARGPEKTPDEAFETPADAAQDTKTDTP